MSFTILWLIWLAFFVAIEGAAIVNRRSGDTLSEHVWRWFAVKEKPLGWRLRRLSLLAFLAWLVTHLLSGGWI